MSIDDDMVLQAGAIPRRDGLFCLITSNNRRRWIFPKGMIDYGNTPRQTAFQEAWEEAGVKGEIAKTPAGFYRYEKWGEIHHVRLYEMEVSEVFDEWPERSFRMRRWVSLQEALERIDNEDICQILLQTYDVSKPKNS